MKLFSITLASLMILAAPWPIGGNYLYVRTIILILAAILSIMALLACLVERKKIRTSVLWAVIPLAAAYAVYQATTFSGPISMSPAATSAQLYVLGSGLAIFFSSTVLFRERKTIEPLMFCAALVGGAVAFVGVIQKLGWNGKVLWVYELLFGGSPFGPFVNQNNAAGFMILAMTGPVYFLAKQFIASGRRQRRELDDYDLATSERPKTSLLRSAAEFFASLEVRHLYSIAALVSILAGIFFSLSRGGSVSVMMGLAVAVGMLISTNRKVVVVAAFVAITCFGGAIWLEQADAVSESMASIAEVTEETDPRLLHWQDAMPYYQQHWLWGSGLGTYRYVYAEFQQQPFRGKFAHAENVYLETLAELGLPGTLALAITLLVLLHQSIQLFRQKLSEDKALGIAGCFAITGLAASSFFDFGIYQPANLILAAILFGAILGRSSHCAAGESNNKLADLSRLYRLAILFLLVMACGYATFPSAAIESVQYARRHLELHLRSGGEEISRLDKAQQALLFSEKHLPDDWEVHYLLGQHSLYVHRQSLAKKVAAETEAALREQAIANGVVGDEVEEQLPSFSDYWTTTSMSNLHRIMRFAQRQSSTEFESMRNDSSIVTPEIREAHRRFSLARDKNASVEKVHFRLAQMTVLMEPIADNLEIEQRHIERALSLAKGYPGLAYDCGLLAMHSGDFETAARLWQDCLSKSRAYERRIIELSGELPLKLFFENVLPQNPYVLLRISRIYFANPEQKLPNQLLLVHTRRLIESSDAPATEKLALLGRAFFQADEFELASEKFALSLEAEPDQTELRFDYARSLHEIQKTDDAIREMKLCQLESPELSVRAARQIRTFKAQRARRRDLPNSGVPE